MMKKWYQIKIKTIHEYQELICDYLQNFPIHSIQISDKQDILDVTNSLPDWVIIEDLEITSDDDILIETYIDQEDLDSCEITKISKKLNSYPNTFCTVHSYQDQSWDREWKKYYTPINVGKTIRIVPAWFSENTTDRTLLFIEPGMAFGTGQHETTCMCIELMEDISLDHKHLLDMGCGSGILSIAAVQLNASSVIAVDIDPLAIEASKKNIELNNISNKIELYEGNLLENPFIDQSFDVIVANILSNIILDFIPLLDNYLNENGVFIASGILFSQKDPVLSAMKSQGLTIDKILHQGEWVAIRAMKNNV